MTITFETTPQQNIGLQFVTERYNQQLAQQWENSQSSLPLNLKSKFVPILSDKLLQDKFNELLNSFYTELLNYKINANKQYIENFLNASSDVHTKIQQLLASDTTVIPDIVPVAKKSVKMIKKV